MGRRYWGMNWSPQESVERHEALREAMIAQSGINTEHLASARRVIKTQGFDREPTLQNGMADSPALIRGEQYNLVDSHVNAHGETVLSAYRRNGPQWEKVRITQAQADEHTRIVTEIRGDR
jgi:hypothetical protein